MILNLVTSENFRSTIEMHPIVVVFCRSDKCTPCIPLEHHLKKLAEKYIDDIQFGVLDIDREIAIAQKLKITQLPYLIFFFEGEIEDTFTGYDPDRIEELMDFLIKRRDYIYSIRGEKT